MKKANPEIKRIAILIPAHNEEKAIGDTVASIKKSAPLGSDIFVIADNCTDATLKIAREAGAIAVARTSGGAMGKGEALSWFLNAHGERLKDFRFVIVFDADSRLGSNFFEILTTKSLRQDRAYQCFVHPIPDFHSPVSQLAALSEFLDQNVSDRIRTILKWPVRLRGTGMILDTINLIELRDQIQTRAEDIAMTLLLADKGIPIERIDEAVVYDQKPGTVAAASRQRARWFQGQKDAMAHYRKQIKSILRKGPSGWALISSLFLRPKWIFLFIGFLVTLLLSRWVWTAWIFWLYILGCILYFAIGLIRIPERKKYIQTIFYFPAYIWMWLRSFVLARHKNGWLKSRE